LKNIIKIYNGIYKKCIFNKGGGKMDAYSNSQIFEQACYLKIGYRCVIKTKAREYIGEFRGTFLPDYFSRNRYYNIKLDNGEIKHIIDDSIISIKNI